MTATMAQKVVGWLHSLPHFNFRLKRIVEPFNVDVNGAYVQSLVVFCAMSLLAALFLLLVIVIVWSRQCCRSKTDQLYRKNRACLLSVALFTVSVICFLLIGVGVYGNDYANKSVYAAGESLVVFSRKIHQAMEQTRKLNVTQVEAVTHLDELTAVIEQRSKRAQSINQTLLREADDVLTRMSDQFEKVRDASRAVARAFVDERFIDRLANFGKRVEFERWLIYYVLSAIFAVCLLAGVVAFCRESLCCTIFFSAAAIVLFIIPWLLFSAAFPLTIAYADFCKNGRPFLQTRINPAILDMFEFYRECDANPVMRDQIPSSVPLHEIGNYYTQIEEDKQQLSGILYALFNRSDEIDEANRHVAGDISASFKSIGAMEATLVCTNLAREVDILHADFCEHGFFGIAVVTFSLFLLGIFMFILMLIVSKSWRFFSKKPNDYVQVGEDDHFSPRGREDIPESVYDTNIYNPRARNLNNNNNSVVDTNNNGSLLMNGGTRTNAASSVGSPLLMMNGGVGHGQAPSASNTISLGTADMWLRGIGAANAAGTNMPSAPPATNTLINSRNSSNYHRLSSNGNIAGYRSHYHQPANQFDEQYEI